PFGERERRTGVPFDFDMVGGHAGYFDRDSAGGHFADQISEPLDEGLPQISATRDLAEFGMGGELSSFGQIERFQHPSDLDLGLADRQEVPDRGIASSLLFFPTRSGAGGALRPVFGPGAGQESKQIFRRLIAGFR